MQTIDIATAHSISPHISITVSHQNLAALPEVIEKVLHLGLPFRINFYRPHHDQAPSLTERVGAETLIDAMCAAFERIEQYLPRYSLVNVLVDQSALGYPHERSCSAGESYLVIDHVGRLSMCQMQIGQPIGSIFDKDPLQKSFA